MQRIVNDLEREGLVALQPTPHRRRAQLVVLTEKERQTFDAAMRLQAPWADSLADGLAVEEMETAHRIITALRKKLEGNGELEEQG